MAKIGDPFKKFRKPSIVQESPEGLRYLVEETMDYDHKHRIPFISAYLVSERSGLPDKWWFEKARALGHAFEDEEAFWEGQKLQIQTRLPEIEALYKEKEGIFGFDALKGAMNPPSAPQYTWDQIKAGDLPSHEMVHPLHKGTFFAVTYLSREAEQLAPAYLKWGMDVVKDLVAFILASQSGRIPFHQRPVDFAEQQRILLGDVDWEQIERLTKEAADGWREYVGNDKEIADYLEGLEFHIGAKGSRPGDFYRKMMNPSGSGS